MIIELIGHSGVGKSTIVNNFISKGYYKKIVTTENIRSSKLFKNKLSYIYFALKVLTKSRKDLFKSFKFVRQDYLNLKVWWRYIVLIHFVIRIERRTNDKFDIILLDQGIIQLIWSIYYISNNELHSLSYFKDLVCNYLPNKIIHVSLSDDDIITRLKSREKSKCSYKNCSDIEIIQSVRKFEIFTNYFLTEIISVDYLRINSCNEVQKNIETIYLSIK